MFQAEVGDHPAGGRSVFSTRSGGGRHYLLIYQGGGPNHPPMYQYVHRPRRLGAVIGDRGDDSSCTAGPLDDLFLAPAFVKALIAELTVDAVFGPILCAAAAALGALVDRFGVPVTDPARASKGGKFLVRCSCTAADRVRLIASASPHAAGCASATMARGQTLRAGKVGLDGPPPRFLCTSRPGYQRGGVCVPMSELPTHQG